MQSHISLFGEEYRLLPPSPTLHYPSLSEYSCHRCTSCYPPPVFFCFLFTPALLQLPPCWPACCGTLHPSTHSECCGSSGVLGILGWSGHYPPFPSLDCLSPIVSLINLTVCRRLYHLQTKLPVTHCIRNWTITSCITYSHYSSCLALQWPPCPLP